MSAPGSENEDEWRKRITSTLMGGPAIILLDNVTEALSSPSLATALTAREWEDRKLGHSENVRLPARAVWFATGNNLRTEGDMPRRCYSIRMDANVAQPWLREGFRIPNLVEWVSQRRGDLLGALLIIARAWVVAGRPPWSGKPLDSFESWCRTIGGALEYAGIHDFLGNLDQMYEIDDAETREWAAFFAAWNRVFANPVPVRQIAEILMSYGRANEQFGAQILRKALPSRLSTAVDRGEGSLTHRLGICFRERRDTVFGKYRLRHAGEDKHDEVALWTVEETKREEPEAPVQNVAGNAPVLPGIETASPAGLPAELTDWGEKVLEHLAGNAGNESIPFTRGKGIETETIDTHNTHTGARVNIKNSIPGLPALPANPGQPPIRQEDTFAGHPAGDRNDNRQAPSTSNSAPISPSHEGSRHDA